MKPNFHRHLLWTCHHTPIVSTFQQILLQLHVHSKGLSNFVGWKFFTVSLQLHMVNGEVLCSDAVGILLDANNTKETQQLSLFLNFSVWKITKPILIQTPPSKSYLKGKLNLKTVNERR